MATSIFFAGRLISVPGSYSNVDASGLEAVGLGASGIVAVLGTAEGGLPVSEITDPNEFLTVNKPETGRELFRAGDLREVMDLLFAPAKDSDILAGAQSVVAMKVNPATTSAADFSNAQGVALELVSADYGAFTGQINVSIADGTNQGKLLTIIFEDVTESVDDLGGDDIFNLKYVKPTDGWDTMTAQVITGGVVVAAGTRDNLGLDSDIGTTLAAPGVIEVVSTGADTNVVTVYGLDGTGAAVSETLTLTGVVAVVGTQTFGAGDVLGVSIAGTTVGTVTVDASPGGATIFSVAPGVEPDAGIIRGAAMYASSLVTLVADGATTKDVLVVGTNNSGAQTIEKITLTGAVAAPGVGVFSLITAVVLGDVEAARTVTISADAGRTAAAVQTTIQKVADYFNARAIPQAVTNDGFTLTLVTGNTLFDPANLDVTLAPVTCLSPADPGFKADLYALVNWINTNSALVVATAATGASGGAPDNTAAPVFLVGGIEGTAAFTNYQAALNLLKQTRVNSIVALTGDPAVHAAIDAHCAYMGGIGRSERDGFAGVMNTALTDVPTKTEYKAAIVNLNSRHMRACGQASERFNSTGVRTEYTPPFTAAIAAGMQAGSSVGTSLTYKFANVLGFRQDSTWNPTDDSEEMVQAGALFMENVAGVGRRWVRNVTTHLSSDNVAFTEGSVNEAVNFAVFNFRTNLEFAVGKKGFSGTVNAAKSVAINTLGLLVDSQILTAWRSLDIELVVDVMEVSVEIAPVIPINFVQSTVHLVTIQQSAA